ncbi:MAG: hypothetical protein IJW53_00270 [Clostridia bacterium]|nr:hypothetical protein [Clostridia bacterium]
MVDYKAAYETYKKFPSINFVITLILSIAWAIIDFSVEITDIEGFLCFIVWPMAGVVLGLFIMYITMIAISPTIVRTDAICELVDLAKE